MNHYFLTMSEYETLKLYAVNDAIYRRIEQAFIQSVGERTAKKFLARCLEKTIRELTCQSYVDIMSIITIL